jgi:hypothetical protein
MRNSENRFWVRYASDGKVIQLYRSSYTSAFFERWDKDMWVDAIDRYERITQDAACDEISAERAQRVINEFAERQLANDKSKSETIGHRATSKDNVTDSATPLKIGTDSLTDGFSALATSAIAMHEVFLGFMSAGFTEDQALKIITGIITSN